MNFILRKNQRTHLLRKRTDIGPSPRAHIRVHTGLQPTFSATILVKNQVASIIDHTRGKTFINGLRINHAFLFDGDIIEIDKKIFTFKIAKTIHVDLTNEENIPEETTNTIIDLTNDIIDLTEPTDINNNSK